MNGRYKVCCPRRRPVGTWHTIDGDLPSYMAASAHTGWYRADTCVWCERKAEDGREKGGWQLGLTLPDLVHLRLMADWSWWASPAIYISLWAEVWIIAPAEFVPPPPPPIRLPAHTHRPESRYGGEADDRTHVCHLTQCTICKLTGHWRKGQAWLPGVLSASSSPRLSMALWYRWPANR